MKLSNSPYESTVLILEARKSFSLRIELHDRHGNLMSWDNLSATFTLGTLDPLEALLEVSATDGVFRIQASELSLKPGTYQFTITLRSRGYSFVIVKGDVKLVQNTEAGSVADLYGAAIPSETIAVQLDQMNVIKVSLRNTPLTLGTGGGGVSTWSELVGKPLVFPPAQHTHDLQDVGGLVQVLTDLTASLGDMAPTVHYHPISDVIGLQPALDAKAETTHTHSEYAPAEHGHGVADVYGLQNALDGKADARACHGEYRGSAATIPTGTPSGSGALTTISGATTTPAPGSVSGETVTLSRDGVYQITADADLQALTTGRAFVDVRANGSTVARATMTGDDRATAAITRRFAAGTAIQMVAYHSQGSSVAVEQFYLTITRLQ